MKKITLDVSLALVFTLLSIACVPFVLFPMQVLVEVGKFFVRLMIGFLKFAYGLDYELRGVENIPKGVHYIMAANHSSHYECLLLGLIPNKPIFILKKQLLFIPFAGILLVHFILVDRSKPLLALKKVNKEMKNIMEKCYSYGPWATFILFPQGSRYPNNEGEFKSGLSIWARKHQLPVLPVALNSGKYCPNSLWQAKKGTVIIEFLPVIYPKDIPDGKISEAVESAIRKKLEEIS